MTTNKMLLAVAFFATTFSFSCKSGEEKNNEMPSIGPTPNTSADSASAAGPTANDTTVAATIPKDNTGKMVDKKTPAKKKGRATIVLSNGKATTGKYTMDKEGVYSNTEVRPEFPGGEKALAKYVEDNIQYPQEAIDNDAEGTVNLEFAVDENGKVYRPKITSDKIGYGLEDEAVRVVNQMPKWMPGKLKGKNVKTSFSLPITYTLQ